MFRRLSRWRLFLKLQQVAPPLDRADVDDLSTALGLDKAKTLIRIGTI